MDAETKRRLQREYLENRVRSAHPVEIVTMLYQVAIDSLAAAIEHLKTGDNLARSREITRAEEAVHELLAALDHSVNVKFTHTLASLYRYCLERMVVGHAQRSADALREASSVLSTLAVAWREVKERVCESPQAEDAPDEPAGEPRQIINHRNSRYGLDQELAGSRGWSC